MKLGLLSGFVFVGFGLFAAPALAQDCSAILQEFDAVSATLSQGASTYWSARNAYIEDKRPGGDEKAKKRRADAEKKKALGAKIGMPQPFERFVTVAGAAQAQKCLPTAEVKARREQAFDQVRRINFDQLPEELATESPPSAAATPRMPVK